MADTKQPRLDNGSARPEHGRGAQALTEGDGVSYSGIVWFVVILAVTTIVCQILMWVLLRAMQAQSPDPATAAAAMAAPAVPRPAEAGRVYPDMVSIGKADGPAPKLLVREPQNLDALRAHERDVLTTYGWVDQNAGTIRIPIDKAKDLLIQRGLAVAGRTRRFRPERSSCRPTPTRRRSLSERILPRRPRAGS